MFRQRIKHYHQWLRSAIHLKTKIGHSSPDSFRIQGPSKRTSSVFFHPVSSVKEHNRKGGKSKISPSRLNTFLLVERFKMETPESIRASLIPGEWVSSIDLLDTYLHIPIHQNSRKYLQFCHRCSSSPPFLSDWPQPRSSLQCL